MQLPLKFQAGRPSHADDHICGSVASRRCCTWKRRMMVQMSPSVSRWFPSTISCDPMFSRCTRCSFRNCRALSTFSRQWIRMRPFVGLGCAEIRTCVHGLYCFITCMHAHFIMHLYLSAVRVNSDIQCMQKRVTRAVRLSAAWVNDAVAFVPIAPADRFSGYFSFWHIWEGKKVSQEKLHVKWYDILNASGENVLFFTLRPSEEDLSDHSSSELFKIKLCTQGYAWSFLELFCF